MRDNRPAPGVLVVDDEESITDLVATARRVAISSGSAKYRPSPPDYLPARRSPRGKFP
jgi:hypothetical protein